MTEFEIDPAYVCSVTIHKVYTPRWEDSEEGLVEALKYSQCITSTSTVDHPEFAKLREKLEEEEYLSVERGWWNGDLVLKPFTLNGKKFKKGAQFPSACAMEWVLKHHDK